MFACGFDAGDCGVDNYDKMHRLDFSLNKSHYNLPPGLYHTSSSYLVTYSADTK